MNRDEAIQRAEMAMAWARGEPVQCKRTYSINWVDIAGPEDSWCSQFFDPDYEWRIKPKPLECWVLFDRSGYPECAWKASPTIADTVKESQRNARWVRMREVE